MTLLEEPWKPYWNEGFNMNGFIWYIAFLALMEYFLIHQKKIFVSENTAPNAPLNYDKIYDYRAGIVFAIVTFLPLIIIATNRGTMADTGLYIAMYKGYPSSIFEIMDFVDWESKDPGFVIFSIIEKQIFGEDPVIWLFIIAAISATCMALTYRRYTSEIVLCAFLYFASTDFFSWMMNGMRQFLVVSILFACFPLLQKKKYAVFILITLLLYTFHSSCLLVIPLYIAALGKPFNKKTMTILGVMLLAVVFLTQFTSFLGSALEETDYAGVVNQFGQDDGTNVLRVLVYSVPGILAVIYRKQIPEDAPPIIEVCVNMALITMGIYVVSMFTSGIYIGRIPIYFSLFNYILLPWEIRTFFPNERKLVMFGMIGAYLSFYIVQVIMWS